MKLSHTISIYLGLVAAILMAAIFLIVWFHGTDELSEFDTASAEIEEVEDWNPLELPLAPLAVLVKSSAYTATSSQVTVRIVLADEATVDIANEHFDLASDIVDGSLRGNGLTRTEWQSLPKPYFAERLRRQLDVALGGGQVDQVHLDLGYHMRPGVGRCGSPAGGFYRRTLRPPAIGRALSLDPAPSRPPSRAARRRSYQ